MKNANCKGEAHTNNTRSATDSNCTISAQCHAQNRPMPTRSASTFPFDDMCARMHAILDSEKNGNRIQIESPNKHAQW